jgi:hypothetical protein
MHSSTDKASQPTATLCVANLHAETSDAELKALFLRCGVAGVITLSPTSPAGGIDRCRYLDVSPGNVAGTIAALHGRKLKGAVLDVSEVAGASGAAEGGAGAATASGAVPVKVTPIRYEVASVEKAEVPQGGEGADWYRYVLTSGRSRITGLHRGTLEEVTAYARGCAEEFNLRSATGKGSAAVAYTRRK